MKAKQKEKDKDKAKANKMKINNQKTIKNSKPKKTTN